MQILLTFLYVIDLLVAVILITLILLQRSKAGGGLGGLATSSAAIEETLGAGAANVLQKMTAIFALIFLVCTVGIGLIQQYIKTPGKTNPLDVAAPTEAVQLEKNAGKAPLPAAGQQKAKDNGVKKEAADAAETAKQPAGQEPVKKSAPAPTSK